MKRFAKILATSLGTGFSPIAPGTVGALGALLIYYLVTPVNPIYLGLLILGLFGVGVWAATVVEKELGHDASQINIDEVVGVLITIWAFDPTPLNLILGFMLFRFFDIVKPFPINRLQDLPAGWGVMLDDVLAGIYGHLILRLIVWKLG
ncbi:phosphatidylglycerophosphatase A [candidate division KSB1 bacterium]|nr:phosphatidylglycerophosphatase A [candidate division KSB1 bacterium]